MLRGEKSGDLGTTCTCHERNAGPQKRGRRCRLQPFLGKLAGLAVEFDDMMKKKSQGMKNDKNGQPVDNTV